MLLLEYTSICLLFLIFTTITGHHHLLINSQSLLIHLSVSCLSPVLFPLRSQRVILKTINCFMQISQRLSIALGIKSKTLTQALVYLPGCHTRRARHTDFCPSFFKTQSYFLLENLYNLTLTLYLPWFSFHILCNIFLCLKADFKCHLPMKILCRNWFPLLHPHFPLSQHLIFFPVVSTILKYLIIWVTVDYLDYLSQVDSRLRELCLSFTIVYAPWLVTRECWICRVLVGHDCSDLAAAVRVKGRARGRHKAAVCRG